MSETGRFTHLIAIMAMGDSILALDAGFDLFSLRNPT
jgi:hypothetical protein